MRVRAKKLEDVGYGNRWFDEVQDHWDYDDLKADPSWRTGWISVDCVLYDEQESRVYLGITSLDAKIFSAYDRGVSVVAAATTNEKLPPPSATTVTPRT